MDHLLGEFAQMIRPFYDFQTQVTCTRLFQGMPGLPQKAMSKIGSYCLQNELGEMHLVHGANPLINRRFLALYCPAANQFRFKIPLAVQEENDDTTEYWLTEFATLRLGLNEWMLAGGRYLREYPILDSRFAEAGITLRVSPKGFRTIDETALSTCANYYSSVKVNEDSYVALTETTIEVYSLSTKNWTCRHRSTVERIGRACSLLQTGKVLIVGGCSPHFSYFDTCEYYDPETNGVSLAPPLPYKVMKHALASLNGGRQVLCCGGHFQPRAANLWEHIKWHVRTSFYISTPAPSAIIDVASETWRVAPPMHKMRINIQVIPISATKVMVFGDEYEPDPASPDCCRTTNGRSREIFDLETEQWTLCSEDLPAF